MRTTLIWITIIGLITAGCASKQARTGSVTFQTKQYMKLLEMEAAAQEKLPAPPEMTGPDYEKLGDVYLLQGETAKALLKYEKALSLSPDKASLHLKKGAILLSEGLNEEAIKAYQKVLQTKADPLAHEGMGQALFRMGRFQQAEKHFKEALQLRPLWKSHSYLGMIYDHWNRFDMAISEHQAAIAIEPQAPLLYNNLGVSFALKGDYDKALVAFQRALRTKEPDQRIYNNMGLILDKMGRSEDAFQAFLKGGDEARAYNNLGCLHLSRGEKDKAVHYLEKAIALEPAYYAKANENLEKAKTQKPGR